MYNILLKVYQWVVMKCAHAPALLMCWLFVSGWGFFLANGAYCFNMVRSFLRRVNKSGASDASTEDRGWFDPRRFMTGNFHQGFTVVFMVFCKFCTNAWRCPALAWHLLFEAAVILRLISKKHIPRLSWAFFHITIYKNHSESHDFDF